MYGYLRNVWLYNGMELIGIVNQGERGWILVRIDT